MGLAEPRAGAAFCASGTEVGADRAAALINWANLPSPLRRKTPTEYELNRGHVIDALRSDYPVLFSKPPDLSFFSPDIVLLDPSGKVRSRGLAQYKRVFGMLRFFRRATMQDAQLTYRLVVDDAASAVRLLMQLHACAARCNSPLLPLTLPRPACSVSDPCAVVCQAVDARSSARPGHLRRWSAGSPAL